MSIVGFILGTIFLLLVIRQLRTGILITRSFTEGVSRERSPAEFWFTIGIELIGVLFLWFGPPFLH